MASSIFGDERVVIIGPDWRTCGVNRVVALAVAGAAAAGIAKTGTEGRTFGVDRVVALAEAGAAEAGLAKTGTEGRTFGVDRVVALAEAGAAAAAAPVAKTGTDRTSDTGDGVEVAISFSEEDFCFDPSAFPFPLPFPLLLDTPLAFPLLHVSL